MVNLLNCKCKFSLNYLFTVYVITMNTIQIHYALVNPKPKPEGLPDQTVDPTAVVYSEVEEEKLAPKSKESENPPQTKTGEYHLFIRSSYFCTQAMNNERFIL